MMKYYSTNGQSVPVSLQEAVTHGLASDKGLFMPERIQCLPQEFYDNLPNLSFHAIAFRVAQAFFGEDVSEEDLKQIVEETLCFDCPLQQVEKNIYSLELFHGPTLAFKDVGARFMARMIGYFQGRQNGLDTTNAATCDSAKAKRTTNVLVATSGDTGSAVANGFLGVEGIHVYVLYPKGKVSPIQECQFTTLGQNITALEIDGVFDDCQALVKNAFMDDELKAHMTLTSANSINVARFLPQAFYYFYAVAQIQKIKGKIEPVVCVPSGNFGNITAALFGREMGLPIKRFIAANNANDVFFQYLQTGKYTPCPSKQTIANAMDVGAPSNFARIYDLYGGDYERIHSLIAGATYSDEQIAESLSACWHQNGYLLDPHGACGYRALKEGLKDGEIGIFCETAHPAKFKQTVEQILGTSVEIPLRLAAFMRGKKQSVQLSKSFEEFKQYLMQQ